ncbi:MAG: hypothetical protein LBC72_05020, partial [Spirochaetaceae bacterium]|nr:hypothetical protein [Spirochaetaceae bacterium]
MSISAVSDCLLLGIDVGSTTVKAVLLEGRQTVFAKYQRHNAHQSETVFAFLKEIFGLFPERTIKIAVCGSGGKNIAELLQVPYIQEVVANSLAVRSLYPHARVAIELGGQDAKIIFFHHNEVSG